MPALTEKGFLRPTYAELLSGQLNRAKELFGDEIDVRENTVLGKFIRIGVYELAQLYEEMEGVYYARFPNFAEGVNLDRLAVFGGLSRNQPVAAEHLIRVYGKKGAAIEEGFLVASRDGVCFYTQNRAVIGESGWVDIGVVCTKRGRIGNVASASINVIVNPGIHLEKIEHIAQLEEGRELETDAMLRKRFGATVTGSGSSTAEAICARVLRVNGVSGCVVEENDTDETSSDGIPAHSFVCYVLGAGASAQEIGKAIFEKKPLGIHAFGKQVVTVFDSQKVPHVIGFSWVEKIALKMRVKAYVNTHFPENGVGQVADRLALYINKFPNGKDVVYSALFPVLLEIEGVEDVEIEISGDGGKTFGTGNMNCRPFQAMRLDRADVQVKAEPYVDR